MRSRRSARRFRWLRRILRPSLYFGSAGHPAQRWLMGWRSLVVTFAAAASLTAVGFILRSRHGESVENAYQVIARLAGGAWLAMMLVGFVLAVDWLRQVGHRIRRYRDQSLLALSRAL
jgi:hypothetical protein